MIKNNKIGKDKIPELYGLQKFLDILVLRGYSKQTIKNYKNSILLTHSWCCEKLKKGLSNATKKDISQFFLYLVNEKNASYSFIRNHRFSLEIYFKNIIEKDYRIKDLVKVKKDKHTPTILTRNEVKKVLRNIEKFKYKIIISLIYSSGLKTLEAVNLKAKDIDLEKQTITIRNAKGKKNRLVVFSDGLKDSLKEIISNKSQNKFLFVSEQGDGKNHLHTNRVQYEFQNALKKADIQKKVTPHDLRHSSAIHFLESGADIEYIQSLLGHKNISTTNIYAKIANPVSKKKKSPLDLILKTRENF